MPKSDVLDAVLFRLHGTMRVIRLEHRHGQVFLAVVRLMIGQFAFVNFFKTGKMHTELSAMARLNSSGDRTTG